MFSKTAVPFTAASLQAKLPPGLNCPGHATAIYPNGGFSPSEPCLSPGTGPALSPAPRAAEDLTQRFQSPSQSPNYPKRRTLGRLKAEVGLTLLRELNSLISQAERTWKAFIF